MKLFFKYCYTFLGISLFLAANLFLNQYIGYRAIGFVILLGVLAVGLVSTLGPTIFAAGLSALAWNFFFIPPRFTLVVDKPEDIFMCLTYLIVACIIGFLTNRIKVQEQLVREREDRTNLLYQFSQDISSSQKKYDFLFKITKKIGPYLKGECAIFLKTEALDQLIAVDETDQNITLDGGTLSQALKVFHSGQMIEIGQDKGQPNLEVYWPLRNPHGISGVMIFRSDQVSGMSADQKNFMDSVLRQLSVSLEKYGLEENLREADKLRQSEGLHQTLLNSISHEMRTPLTVLMASGAMMTDPKVANDSKVVITLGEEVLRASDRLNRVIENLLDMSRLNSGFLELKLEWHDVGDLIGVTLQKLKVQIKTHELKVDLQEGLPLIRIDFRFMEHALSNLILNASMYSPPGTDITVLSEVDGESLKLEVKDQGQGIPHESLRRVFDKFYRVPGSPTGGTGLGLSIVKSIVEAHQGLISVENNPDQGARFILTIPIHEIRDFPSEEPV